MPKNITISISDELAKKMDAMPEINWSEVCRQSISRYVEEKGTEERGELLKALDDHISKTPPTSEDKQKIRKEEIERFTKKWGTPDSTHDLSVLAPYIGISKKHTVKSGDEQIAELYIENRTKDAVHFTLKDFNPELYNEKIKAIADYLKSVGFDCGETHLESESAVTSWVTHSNKNFARDRLDKGHNFYGIFAQDKDDYVFIAYREVKPK